MAGDSAKGAGCRTAVAREGRSTMPCYVLPATGTGVFNVKMERCR